MALSTGNFLTALTASTLHFLAAAFPIAEAAYFTFQRSPKASLPQAFSVRRGYSCAALASGFRLAPSPFKRILEVTALNYGCRGVTANFVNVFALALPAFLFIGHSADGYSRHTVYPR